MTDDKKISTLHFRYLRPNGASTKVERSWHAADAGARLREARRAVPAHQVAARVWQEPRADVHRARQAAEPGPEAGDHRRAGEVHRRELQRRAAVQVRLLGRLARRAEVEPLQRARQRQRRQGQVASARSWRAPTRCWSAPTRRSASPSTKFGVETVRRPPDRRRRVPPRLGQPRQQARRCISASSSPATRRTSSP